MGPPSCLHHVALSHPCGHARGWSTPLDVDANNGRFNHGREAEALRHQAKTWARGCCNGNCPGKAGPCNRLYRGDFIFHLYEGPAALWDNYRSACGNFRCRGDGIACVGNASLAAGSTAQPFNHSIISGKQDSFIVLGHNEAPNKPNFQAKRSS